MSVLSAGVGRPGGRRRVRPAAAGGAAARL